MSQLPTPVYELKTTSSTSEPASWESLDAIAQQLASGYVVLWQHHTILTGVINGGNVSWLNGAQPVGGDEHLLRLRAFNETKEYHFWRSGSKIIGRLRVDVSGDGQEYIDTSMMLRGVVGGPLQKAHTELAVKDLSVVTRNYIGYDETTQQAGYVDSRFVKFQPFNPNN